MSKEFVRLIQHRGRRKKGNTAQLAAQLAPLEEQNQRAAEKQGLESQKEGKGPGAIVIENEQPTAAAGIGERQTGKRIWGIEPVVVVILIMMLAFIAFITWQISLMPPQ